MKFLTQRRVTAPLLGHPLRGRPTAGGYAQAGLAFCSEPSRAGCACREAIRLGERSELRSSRKAPRECRETRRQELEVGVRGWR